MVFPKEESSTFSHSTTTELPALVALFSFSKKHTHSHISLIAEVINTNCHTTPDSSIPVDVGAKAKTPPFARGLRCSRWSDRDKTGGDTLRSIRHLTKTGDEGIPQYGLAQLRGPRTIRPIVTGPAWRPRVTGLICKGIPVITVCNPTLWEYSGDNLGS
jgi:hypothetical protein